MVARRVPTCDDDGMRYRAWLVGSCLVGCGPSTSGGGGESSSATDGGCTVGEIACACTPGGGCDPGLQCVIGVCVPQDLDTGVGETIDTITTSADTTSAESSSSGVADTGPVDSSSSSSDDSSTTGVALPCGNGRLEGDEVCDDGNTVDGDGCNSDCNPGGQEIWTQTWDGDLGYDDRGNRLAIDADDDIYVAGVATRGVNEGDGVLVKFDDDGQLQWSAYYDSDVGNSNDGFWGVAIAADQSVIATGYTDTDANVQNPIVMMFSADGDPLWTYVEPNVLDTGAYDVVVDSFGDVIVTGFARDPMDAHHQTWLAKLDPADGTPIWNLRIDDPALSGNLSLAIDDDDELAMGYCYGLCWAQKRDDDGVELWTWTNLMQNGGFGGVAAGPTGELLVIGSNDAALYLARHPSAGIDPDWTDDWPGDLAGGAYGNAGVYDSAGRAVVAGSVTGIMGDYALFARKYDVGDAAVWTHEEPDAYALDILEGVAVDSFDQPVIGGTQRTAEGDTDIFVRKLTQ